VKPRVLVVDDEERMAAAIAVALGRSGCDCETATSGERALAAFEARGADVVVTDWRMPGMDGLALLKRLRAASPALPMILVTAHGDVPSAVAAMREGAFDYVLKPFDNDELRSIVARALEIARLTRENRQLRRELAGRAEAGADLVAASPAMKAVLDLCDRAAPSKAPVLIQGESGTGKELLARRVHVMSDRVGAPFVAVNCKAFAAGVLESELFGHEKGAFTGAHAARAGCFERASGGTIFLDEIGEVSLDFQAQLLRVLQEGEVQRVGGEAPRKVDARVVAATNRSLAGEVAASRFREDLFFRLNVIPVRVPPLRQRREEVLPLARHFLARHAAESGRALALDPAAEERLLAHDWPGNVRELENAVERASVLARTDAIGPEDLLLESGAIRSSTPAPGDVGDAALAGTLQECLDRVTAAKIRAALADADGRRADAALALGVDRTTLYRLMKRLGLAGA
jgi:DNA-binding NtrC family response regulator